MFIRKARRRSFRLCFSPETKRRKRGEEEKKPSQRTIRLANEERKKGQETETGDCRDSVNTNLLQGR